MHLQGFLTLKNIKLGDRSNVNLNCLLIAGSTAKIVFGEDCVMGPGVKIIASNHMPDRYDIIPTHSIDQADIIIGNDVWLGANVVVLPGVKIGDGAIVGSGSIVTKNITPYTIMIGIPAKKLKNR